MTGLLKCTSAHPPGSRISLRWHHTCLLMSAGEGSVNAMFCPDHSFGLVALPGIPLDSSVPPELHLDPDRIAVRGCPLPLDGDCGALGTLTVARLRATGLTFLAQDRDRGPGQEAAVREAGTLFRALQLVGFVTLDDHPVWVAGHTNAAGPVPERHGEHRRPRVPPGAPTPPLGWVELGYALRLREGLREIEDHAPAGLIQRAVATFVSGTHRVRPEERVHEFVRALETLVAPTDASAGYRKAFLKRLRLFFGHGHDALLERLYRLKRQAAHGRDVRGLYSDPAEHREPAVSLWHDAVTAEILTRAVVQRLLVNPRLRQSFTDEKAAEGFFSNVGEAEERLWGRAISVPEARRAFRPGRVQPDALEL